MMTGDLLRARRRRMAGLIELLQRCEGVTIARGVDQLDHALQTATLARRAGAPPDLIFGALMHDVGRLIAPQAHGLTSAELIAPFVSSETYQIVRLHDEIRLLELAGVDGPVSAAPAFKGEPWFPLACRFADEWDRYGFDPHARPLPLPFFLPMMEDLCARRP